MELSESSDDRDAHEIDSELAPGEYEVITDEELIRGLSFPVYRRVATLIFLPVDARRSATEIVPVDPTDLAEAHDRDGTNRAGLKTAILKALYAERAIAPRHHIVRCQQTPQGALKKIEASTC
jgi:hypothetical protein